MANPFEGGKNSEMYKGKSKDKPKVMARQDFSDDKIGPKVKSDKPKAETKNKETKTSFNQAFRAARNAGKDTFTWNGKEYTTELAGEKTTSMPTGLIGSRSSFEEGEEAPAFKRGGSVKKAKPKCMARGGGCEVRGKTKGRFV